MCRKLLQLGLVWLLSSWAGLTDYALAQGALPKEAARESTQYRVLHLVLRGNPPELAKAWVNTAKASGFNAIQFMLTDGVAMDMAPWTPKRNAWTKAQLLDWVAHIRSRGLEPIPEVKLLTQQDKFLAGKHPELLFNTATYDPRKEAVYALVFPYLDEIIENIRPKIIHIGHDEVWGWSKAHELKKLKSGETSLPAELFVEDVLRLHAYLRKKGIEVWMWGDMLLSPEEFPSMLNKHLNGGMPGYGKAVRDRLPRDIVICDWHYFDNQKKFPSLARMQSEGFRVIASTWRREATIRNFARYAHEQRAYGLMATTWYSLHSTSVYLPLVEWIVRASGQLFQNPSARDVGSAPPLPPSPVGG